MHWRGLVNDLVSLNGVARSFQANAQAIFLLLFASGVLVDSVSNLGVDLIANALKVVH